MLAAPAAAADDLQDAHKKLLGRGDIQFQFETPVAPPPPVDNWLIRAIDAIAPVFNIIFWAALAAAILAIAYFVIREIVSARNGADNKVKSPVVMQETIYRPDQARAQALLEDADRLAADDKFEEAVHVLLYRSIDDIAQQHPRAVRPAQTSRELSNLKLLPAAARSAMAPLVQAVERSWFGGAPVDRAAYDRCRASYLVFASPGSWA